MKIKAIRISGFRGIPPHDPSPVNLMIPSRDETSKDLLIFGPNAYGKSSIADALEWFFKERSRNETYYHEYNDSHNVHLNIGKDGFPNTATIELDVIHDGKKHTVRKEIGTDGKKAGEDLGAIGAAMRTVEDDVIVLDHEQFRKFVTDAHATKWATFSSLIGFQELEHFRTGLESVFNTRVLNDRLSIHTLRSAIDEKKRLCKELAEDTSTKLGCETPGLEFNVLADTFLARMVAFLAEQGIEHASHECLEDITAEWWDGLFEKLQPSANVRKLMDNLIKCKEQRDRLQPFDDGLKSKITALGEEAQALAVHKENFDKQLLDRFYGVAGEVVRAEQLRTDECPLCGNSVDWDSLEARLSERRASLAFTAIEESSSRLTQLWSDIKQRLNSVTNSAKRASIEALTKPIADVEEKSKVDKSVLLATFDETAISRFVDECERFSETLVEQRTMLSTRVDGLEEQLNQDGFGKAITQANDLKSVWDDLLKLRDYERSEMEMKDRLKRATAITSLAAIIAKNFREELSDFNGRVANEINKDIETYYEAIHFDDAVKPYLDVRVKGKSREVNLRCNFKGVQDQEAVTLLSESHRNSLGLAIFLAFMKFKRKSGSPVEFCVLDDITQSFDTGHRAGLLRLLESPDFPEISNFQFIFLTHDRTLADYICRPGEGDNHDRWCRFDITYWQLHGMSIEPSKIKDLLEIAKAHLDRGDDLAAAVYGRHALEWTYRKIVESANILMPYNAKPWTTKLETYLKAIQRDVQDLWEADRIVHGGRTFRRGIIDPTRINSAALQQGLRILHLTVHDSDFLENPPSTGDIRVALTAAEDLRDIFTCPHCRQASSPLWRFAGRLTRDNQGNPPKCKCDNPFPSDS